MFERSLIATDNRVQTLSREFNQLLFQQHQIILDSINILSKQDATSEKFSALQISYQSLTNQSQHLKKLAPSESELTLQENIFINIHALKNSLRPLLNAIHTNLNDDFEEKQTVLLEDKDLRSVANSLELSGKVRSQASVAAALVARDTEDTSPRIRSSISNLLSTYHNFLSVTELQEMLDRLETNLEYKWKALTQAQVKFLTTAKLKQMAIDPTDSAQKKAAQEILNLIYKKLIIPEDIEKKIHKLETDIEVLLEKVKTLTDFSDRQQLEESIALIKASMLGMQFSQSRMFENLLNHDMLEQLPKKDLSALTNWVKQRNTQFRNSIDDANQQLQAIRKTLTPEVKQPSIFKRLGMFFSKTPGNKVLPKSAVDALLRKKKNP